ncbi:MAG: undecaprenyldiphospho-muramoylpentapeptide beta-N-acetylglucosaminyltransferase [Chloroflexi bacterium]|nr:undecaprenyldiphospho-muramoylpentapeptide beta-N-acetylglucosaminyltransferase [Chloroflexota bacterium]
MRMMVAGGGTGGHVYPALAVIEELLASEALASSDICYLGSPAGIELELAGKAGLRVETVQSGQVRGKAPWQAAASLWRMGQGITQARAIIREARPDVALVTGGYVGVPAALAARSLWVPVVIYLPDLEPGLAVRALSRLVQRVAVTTDEVRRFFPAAKTVVTGYPVRRAIRTAQRAEARQRLWLSDGRPTLLVTGGSRGARSINQAVTAAAEEALASWQVVHITGPLDYETVLAARSALPAEAQARYQVREYLHEMEWALAAADLVVARAGASVLGELPVRGLPAILVPYPYAGQHQEANAAHLVSRGAALRVADAQLGAELPGLLRTLAEDPARLREMGRRAADLARPDAAAQLAAQLRQLALATPWGR